MKVALKTSLLFSLVLAATTLSHAFAQLKLSGKVTDDTGNVLPGVHVKLKPDCKCSQCTDPVECKCCPSIQFFTTDNEGKYEFLVSPGSYSVGVAGTQVKTRVDSGNKHLDLTVH